MELEGSMPHYKGSPIIPILIGMAPISLRSILTLSHLRLDLPRALFPYVYLIKFWKHSHSLPFWLHLNLLDLITLTKLGERYKLWSSSLWSLVHSPFLSLLGPNIRVRILLQVSSPNVRDHDWQPYSTTDIYFVWQRKDLFRTWTSRAVITVGYLKLES